MLLPWEHTVSKILDVFRLGSIKRKILVFSLLATLIPSLSMGWIFYRYADRFVTEQIAQDLGTVAKKRCQSGL